MCVCGVCVCVFVCVHRVVLPPPVDKRLLSLRQGLGGGNTGVGLGQLLHSGWTSFNSDASNLTSGSATSANRCVTVLVLCVVTYQTSGLTTSANRSVSVVCCYLPD